MGAPLDRRAFVARVTALGGATRLPVLGGALSSLALGACAGTTVYLAPSPDPRGLTVAKPDVDGAGSVFVQSPEMERPVFLHRSTDGSWNAVLASCTHRGCQPEPLGERLVCPCHGSEFSLGGEVLQGPADRPLTRFEVIDRGGRLLIVTREDRS